MGITDSYCQFQRSEPITPDPITLIAANRRGYFWGDRFKSVIVEKGETLISCLAYNDLNPIRAGLVERPKEYRWNSLGYHIQTGNKDNFYPWILVFKNSAYGMAKKGCEVIEGMFMKPVL
jgi:hypothetical protein